MLPAGNPAIGADFIDREKEIAQILAALKKDNVLLIAPRRFGKTSIMRRMEKELIEQDIISVFLEVEDVYTSQGKHYFEHYSQRLYVFYKGMGGMEEKELIEQDIISVFLEVEDVYTTSRKTLIISCS